MQFRSSNETLVWGGIFAVSFMLFALVMSKGHPNFYNGVSLSSGVFENVSQMSDTGTKEQTKEVVVTYYFDNSFSAGLAVIVAAFGVGLLISLLLARPLYLLLSSCENYGQTAAFWTFYVSILILLAPVIGGLFYTVFPVALRTPPDIIVLRGLFFSLAGLTVALIIIGRNLFVSLTQAAPQPKAEAQPGMTTMRSDAVA